MKGMYKDLRYVFVRVLILAALLGWVVIEGLIWVVTKILMG
jgi:hypothetical protein